MLAKNPEILLNELPSMELSRLAPADDAFYVDADIYHLTNHNETFCINLLEPINSVCCAP